MKEQVVQFLEKEIKLNHLPGAVVQVMHKGEVVLRQAVGSRYVYPGETASMTADTMFDLASLTKVVATLPAILKLMDEGEVRLDDPVTHFIPDFSKHHKECIKLRHLLTHTSGLPAHRQFYKNGLSADEVIAKVNDEECVASIGTEVIYSDLGYILLYHIIEKVTEQPFDKFLEKSFYHPLGMTETQFCPTFSRERYAATEYSETLIDYKFGIVHDDNAESMGGISGHAGLFSTMEDLTIFSQLIENEGTYKGKQFLSATALNLARSNFTEFSNEHRGLGWMRKSPTLASCGDYFSAESYGHTGFTGTSMWFDPAVNLNVILLTNRVHYGRQPHIIRLRPRLHNIIRRYF